MSKSVVLSSVLLSGSLCFVGVQLGDSSSSTVSLQPVDRVEPVGVSGPAVGMDLSFPVTPKS